MVMLSPPEFPLLGRLTPAIEKISKGWDSFALASFNSFSLFICCTNANFSCNFSAMFTLMEEEVEYREQGTRQCHENNEAVEKPGEKRRRSGWWNGGTSKSEVV